MTKILTILFLFCGAMAFGQMVQIDTFRFNESQQIRGIQSEKMNYPIIRSGNANIDSLINNDLKNRFTNNEYINLSIEPTLIRWADKSILYLDFEVTYNQGGILSINLSAEGFGAYSTNWTNYFNYAVDSGKYLEISDIIENAEEFQFKVNKDLQVQFKKQKEQLKEMLEDPDSDLDKLTYEWALENYRDCRKNTDLQSFSIYSDQIKIIEDCSMPKAIKYLSPIFELKYKFSEIEEGFKFKQ